MENKTHKVSSEQLMHFIQKQKYLIEILNHNFYPRLCCEDTIKPFFKAAEVHVPMKCFCDIPIECIHDHMQIYGPYGVGFTKSWGVQTGLTPVIYYNEKSPYVQYMKSIYNENRKKVNNNSLKDSERLAAAELIRMLKSSFTMYKPVYGKNSRKSNSGNHYCFYDEREWRYLITVNSDLSSYLQDEKLPQEMIDDYNGVEKNGTWTKGRLELSNQIEFTYDDIDFVIIPTDNEKKEILEKLSVSSNVIDKLRNKFTTIEALTKEL